MKEFVRKLITNISPLIGAGGIGVCPLCWAASASFLSYLGLAALIPWVRWIAFGFIALGGIGFVRDFRFHRNVYPLLLLVGGALLLYLGRYVYGGAGFGGWPIWGTGALLIVAAVLWNRQLFRRHGQIHPQGQ